MSEVLGSIGYVSKKRLRPDGSEEVILYAPYPEAQRIFEQVVLEGIERRARESDERHDAVNKK